MQKPLDLQIEDFREGLTNFINTNQQLPFSVIVMIVNEIHDSINRQYAQYKKQLQESYEMSIAEDAKRKEQESLQNIKVEAVASEGKVVDAEFCEVNNN